MQDQTQLFISKVCPWSAFLYCIYSNTIFDFALGVRVTVIGTIGSSNANLSAPVSSYTVDGNLLATFEPILHPTAQRHQQFFQSPIFSNGGHTLIVTSLRNNCDPFLLDYFIVEASASSISLSASPTATSPGSSLPKHHISTAALAGSITAGVIGIFLIISVVYFFLRRRRIRPASNTNIISSCTYFLLIFQLRLQ